MLLIRRGNWDNEGNFPYFLKEIVVELLFYVHGKHLRSCRNSQLTLPHFSWAGLDHLSS